MWLRDVCLSGPCGADHNAIALHSRADDSTPLRGDLPSPHVRGHWLAGQRSSENGNGILHCRAGSCGGAASAFVRFKVLADYWALIQAGSELFIVITTFAGFCFGSSSDSYDFR